MLVDLASCSESWQAVTRLEAEERKESRTPLTPLHVPYTSAIVTRELPSFQGSPTVHFGVWGSGSGVDPNGH